MGKPTAVQVGDEQLFLVRLADQVVAFPDRCPHRSAPLSEGTLDGAVLTCFRHTWQFDVRTGAPVRLLEWRGRRPLARLREAIGVMRAYLDDGVVDHQGASFRTAI